MNKRQIKDLLYGHVAEIGKALASPKRLELLELLSQSPKTVETLVAETGMDVKLASAHLKALKTAGLVASMRQGRFQVYRLVDDDVAKLWVTLRQVASLHLDDFAQDLQRLVKQPDALTPWQPHELLSHAAAGKLVLIDVRPRAEYDLAHLPHARSMPLSELGARLHELPREVEIVAYCRGPFCLFADEALALLRAHGYKAYKSINGTNEWAAAGLPLQTL